MKLCTFAVLAALLFLTAEPCIAARKSESPAAIGITLSFGVGAQDQNLISGSAVLYSALGKKRTAAAALVAVFAVSLLAALAKNRFQENQKYEK